jgi:hypothetical protein
MERDRPPKLAQRGSARFHRQTAKLHITSHPARRARRAIRVRGLKPARGGGTSSDVRAGHQSAQRFHAFIPFGDRIEFIKLADEEKN